MTKGEIVEKKCSVENCTGRHYANSYCKRHYAQVLRHGRLTPERERGEVRVCKAEDCGRTDTIKWYCRKHARQLRVHGRLTPEREHVVGRQGCAIDDCDLPHRAKGLCAKHYNAHRNEERRERKADVKRKPRRRRAKAKQS